MRVGRKKIVGGVGVRVGEEIAVDREVEPLLRLPATLWLGARHQGVGAEGDERANAVRLAFENGAIEIAGRDPAPCRRAEWTLCETQGRSEEHTSELQSLMRISYAVFCLKKKKKQTDKKNFKMTQILYHKS